MPRPAARYLGSQLRLVQVACFAEDYEKAFGELDGKGREGGRNHKNTSWQTPDRLANEEVGSGLRPPVLRATARFVFEQKRR
jgi:hypothetical protein